MPGLPVSEGFDRSPELQVALDIRADRCQVLCGSGMGDRVGERMLGHDGVGFHESLMLAPMCKELDFEQR